MPEFVAYTCMNITCDGYGNTWPVEVGHDGLPLDEAEARCPDCYGPARLANPAAAV